MSSIPRHIYQSWKTKKLTGKYLEASNKIRQLNPEYEYSLYDDSDCRAFLLEHFGENYANAFDSLLHGAFKCDFWRYAILYVYGGIYIDMDMIPFVSFDELLVKVSDVHFISIVDKSISNITGVYQAFIACTPKHPILLQTLELCFANIATRRSGILNESLSVTGPAVMATAVNLYWKNPDTNARLPIGQSGDVLLFSHDGEYTYDLSGKKIFQNKFENYTTGMSYSYTTTHFVDDPRKSTRQLIIYSVITTVIILFLLYLLSRYRLLKCEARCPVI